MIIKIIYGTRKELTHMLLSYRGKNFSRQMHIVYTVYECLKIMHSPMHVRGIKHRVNNFQWSPRQTYTHTHIRAAPLHTTCAVNSRKTFRNSKSNIIESDDVTSTLSLSQLRDYIDVALQQKSPSSSRRGTRMAFRVYTQAPRTRAIFPSSPFFLARAHNAKQTVLRDFYVVPPRVGSIHISSLSAYNTLPWQKLRLSSLAKNYIDRFARVCIWERDAKP